VRLVAEVPRLLHATPSKLPPHPLSHRLGGSGSTHPPPAAPPPPALLPNPVLHLRRRLHPLPGEEAAAARVTAHGVDSTGLFVCSSPQLLDLRSRIPLCLVLSRRRRRRPCCPKTPKRTPHTVYLRTPKPPPNSTTVAPSPNLAASRPHAA
jgi:hypothetical protein